ncbi:MAG: PqqD family protein [Acidobacteriota bacterium]
MPADRLVSPNDRLSFATDVVLQVIEGEALLLKLGEEAVFSLNETGARIAQLLDERHTVGAIVDRLSEEYGMSRGAVEAEVRQLLETLLGRGLVIRDRTSA